MSFIYPLFLQYPGKIWSQRPKFGLEAKVDILDVIENSYSDNIGD